MNNLDLPTRPFDTTAVISLISGILINNPSDPERNAFNDMHELIEFVAGGPVWTHMLGDKDFFNNLKQRTTIAIGDDSDWLLPICDQVHDAPREQRLPIAYEAFYIKPVIDVMELPQLSIEELTAAFCRPLEGKNVITVAF